VLPAAVGLGVYGLLTALYPGDGPFWSAFQNITEVLAAAAATLACVVRAKRERAARDSTVGVAARAWTAWSLIAAGLGAWTLGQIGWCVIVVGLGGVPPEVSLLDVAFLLSPVLIVVGLLTMVRTPAGYLSNLRAAIEGLFIASGVLLLSWSLIVGAVSASTATSTFAEVVNLAYPLLDVLAISAVLSVAFWRRNDPPRGLGLLGLGIACLAVSDSSYWYMSATTSNFQGSTALDTGWVAGFLLIAFAALRPPAKTARGRRRMNVRRLLAIPALPAVLGAGAVVTRWGLGGGLGRTPGTLFVIVTVVVLLGAVLLLTVSYENDALRSSLERRVEERTAELHATERYYRALVQHASDVVMVVGPDLSIRYLSSSLQDMFGLRPEALIGRDVSVFGGEAGKALTEALDLAALAPAQIARIEWTLNDAAGRARRVESTITNLLADPHVGALVLNTRDVTERVELERQLRHQAFHDPLTGLPNRALLGDRAAQAFARSRRTGTRVAAIVADLDGFKLVNDSLGHQAGDELLRSVAQRLRSVARPEDTVARIGGDEFLVLIDAVDADGDALVLAERLHDALRPAFVLAGSEYSLTTSIGVAVGSAAKTNFEQLQSDADVAMYTVKAGGKDAVRLFQPSMHRQAREHLRLQSDLHKALENDELWLLYQPQFDISGGRLEGFEALVRWNHPTRGLVRPDRFIALAEESGLIVQIGRWVLREALRQAAAWATVENAAAAPSIAVNVSTVQIKAPSLLADVTDALRQSGIAPTRVVLEITESSLIEDSHSAIGVLRALKELGVRIAIDDFGTGYASLAYLQEMPVDILKIDQSFVASTDIRGRELLEAIIDIGRTLSLTTIVEGIEQPDQLATVKSFGCDIAQGYLLGRPLPAEEAQQLIERQSATRSPAKAAAAA
jgi:diguanylate cyclase (GGDEF)-like protein/PAS domain S-box-containing protein